MLTLLRGTLFVLGRLPLPVLHGLGWFFGRLLSMRQEFLLATPSFGPSPAVPGPAYPLAAPFVWQCLNSRSDATGYYALC